MRPRSYYRRILAVMGLIFVVGCASTRQPLTQEEEAELLFSKALDLQANEEFASAEAMLKAFVAKYPESDRADDAQLAIGHGYYLRGDYEAAIEAYRLVAKEGDVADQAQLAIGDAYLALNQVDRARKAYRQLLHKYPYLNNEEAQRAQEHLDAIEELETLQEQIRTGEESTRDNAQFYLAKIYFDTFQDYTRAIREFQRVYEKYPESELADDAMWMVGECYWARGDAEPLPRGMSEEQQAFTRLQYILAVYPQLIELLGPRTEIRPHWPAGKRGDRYELYYAEVRRLINRYPDLKSRIFSDYLNEDYRTALTVWDELMKEHSNSDAAARAPEQIARHLIDLGKRYYNSGLAHFSSVLMRESLRFAPLPEAHIYLAYYYADLRSHVRSTYYLTRSFQHVEAAEKLVPPGSDLASDLKQLKSWLNYRMRLEALEALYYSKLRTKQ